MPLLALTRAGVASFVQGGPKATCLWVGSDVLSEPEIEKLQALNLEVSVFVHPVRTQDEIEDAIPTLREHHPNESVWIEALPESYNTRSADFGQAFLWREYIVGVEYEHNDHVEVVSGSHQGESGNLIALVGLQPEPEFVLEAESGQDIQVLQSSIARADA
jgi:hypothetical protein